MCMLLCNSDASLFLSLRNFTLYMYMVHYLKADMKYLNAYFFRHESELQTMQKMNEW